MGSIHSIGKSIRDNPFGSREDLWGSRGLVPGPAEAPGFPVLRLWTAFFGFMLV